MAKGKKRNDEKNFINDQKKSVLERDRLKTLAAGFDLKVSFRKRKDDGKGER
jgi:hypothetical protein